MTYLESSLAVIVHLELNHDALIEIQLSELKGICRSDEVHFTETVEQLSNFICGNGWAIFALHEEEASKKLASVACRGVEGSLTMSLGLLTTARTTLDQTTSTLANSSLSMLRQLTYRQEDFSEVKYQEITYAVLAESKGHVFCVAANLDPDRAKFTEDLGDCDLKGLITLGLKKAEEAVSMELWRLLKRTHLATKIQQAGGKSP